MDGRENRFIYNRHNAYASHLPLSLLKALPQSAVIRRMRYSGFVRSFNRPRVAIQITATSAGSAAAALTLRCAEATIKTLHANLSRAVMPCLLVVIKLQIESSGCQCYHPGFEQATPLTSRATSASDHPTLPVSSHLVRPIVPLTPQVQHVRERTSILDEVLVLRLALPLFAGSLRIFTTDLRSDAGSSTRDHARHGHVFDVRVDDVISARQRFVPMWQASKSHDRIPPSTSMTSWYASSGLVEPRSAKPLRTVLTASRLVASRSDPAVWSQPSRLIIMRPGSPSRVRPARPPPPALAPPDPWPTTVVESSAGSPARGAECHSHQDDGAPSLCR